MAANVYGCMKVKATEGCGAVRKSGRRSSEEVVLSEPLDRQIGSLSEDGSTGDGGPMEGVLLLVGAESFFQQAAPIEEAMNPACDLPGDELDVLSGGLDRDEMGALNEVDAGGFVVRKAGTQTPSGMRMWKCTLRFRTLPNRWTVVIEPHRGAWRPRFLAARRRCPKMVRSTTARTRCEDALRGRAARTRCEDALRGRAARTRFRSSSSQASERLWMRAFP
jgi:hypothetical protein